MDYRDLLEKIYGVKVKDYTPTPEELARTHQFLEELHDGRRTLSSKTQEEPLEER